MHRHNLPWWRKQLGHLKIADITPAILVEMRGKLARETSTRAKPSTSSRTTLKKGEQPRQFKRSPTTVNRNLGVLSHLFTIVRREMAPGLAHPLSRGGTLSRERWTGALPLGAGAQAVAHRDGKGPSAARLRRAGHWPPQRGQGSSWRSPGMTRT